MMIQRLHDNKQELLWRALMLDINLLNWLFSIFIFDTACLHIHSCHMQTMIYHIIWILSTNTGKYNIFNLFFSFENYDLCFHTCSHHGIRLLGQHKKYTTPMRQQWSYKDFVLPLQDETLNLQSLRFYNLISCFICIIFYTLSSINTTQNILQFLASRAEYIYIQWINRI